MKYYAEPMKKREIYGTDNLCVKCGQEPIVRVKVPGSSPASRERIYNYRKNKKGKSTGEIISVTKPMMNHPSGLCFYCLKLEMRLMQPFFPSHFNPVIKPGNLMKLIASNHEV